MRRRRLRRVDERDSTAAATDDDAHGKRRPSTADRDRLQCDRESAADAILRPTPANEPARMPLFPIRAPPEDETISRFVLDPRRDGEIGFTADALVVTGLRNELDGNRSLTFFADERGVVQSSLPPRNHQG